MTTKDILELFFEALERPQPTIVTEMLSNGFDEHPSNVVK
jgi:hypothetical protein